MDNRRGCNAAPDEERWLFMGSHPCCPPSPEHRDDPGTLFDEVERVVLLEVTALIALDNLYRRSSNRQAAAMTTIEVMEASEAEQGRSSTSKHSRWSDLDEQRLLAYKRASLRTRSLASSQAGLGLQYVRAIT